MEVEVEVEGMEEEGGDAGMVFTSVDTILVRPLRGDTTVRADKILPLPLPLPLLLLLLLLVVVVVELEERADVVLMTGAEEGEEEGGERGDDEVDDGEGDDADSALFRSSSSACCTRFSNSVHDG